jgi:hypothetical protein
MQQSQRGAKNVNHDGARDVAILARAREAQLHRLDIPVSELIPDEAPRGLRVLAETESCAELLLRPHSVARPAWPKCGIAFRDCHVEAMENPAVGSGERALIEIGNRFYRVASGFR